jgi:pimeloyl-ACP methyl ester carboxylesterase
LIDCPVAVIWGDRDPYCDVHIARGLAAGIPRGRLHLIAGADHFIMEERPDDVLAALRELLARAIEMDAPARAGAGT